MRAKSNIGPDDGGFAYELERVEVAPEVEGQRVRWLEVLQGSARELLADAEAESDSEEEGGAGDAAECLRVLLGAGPVAVRDLKRSADDAGYSWRTMQRAMRRAGAESRRPGFGQSAVWYLKSSRATVAPVAPHSQAGAIGATGGATDDAELI